MTIESNPFAPPQASGPPSPSSRISNDEDERIRRELLTHEATIQSIGSLYLMGAIFSGLGTIGMLIGSIAGLTDEGTVAEGIGFGLVMTSVYGLMCGALGFSGLKLRRLDPRGRPVATVIAAFGLIGFPFGTLINAYILYLMHGKKGKRVLTQEYQDIIARTPHIKYRTPVWVLVFVGLVILLLTFSVVMAVVS